MGWILTCASSSNPTAKGINVQCTSINREFYQKNDHFNKNSETKSKHHLKVSASKSNENTLVTKNLTNHSHTNCWTQVCLMLQLIFAFFFNVLYSPKSSRNRRKRKRTSRKRHPLVSETDSTQVKNIPTYIHCSFSYHDQVIESSYKSWFWYFWDYLWIPFKQSCASSSIFNARPGNYSKFQDDNRQVLFKE